MKTSSIREPNLKDLPLPARWLGKLYVHRVNARFRRTVLKQERERLPLLDRVMRTFEREKTRADKHGLTDLSRLYNVGLFMVLMFRDLSGLRVDMVARGDLWRVNFASRQTAVVIFESLEDLTQLLGKELRHSIQTLDPSGEVIDALNPICKRLNAVKNTHHKALSRIRNFVSAHRHHDALAFLKEAEGIDPWEVFSISAEFIGVLNSLIPVLVAATQKGGSFKSLLRQLSGNCPTALNGPPSESCTD